MQKDTLQCLVFSERKTKGKLTELRKDFSYLEQSMLSVMGLFRILCVLKICFLGHRVEEWTE